MRDKDIVVFEDEDLQISDEELTLSRQLDIKEQQQNDSTNENKKEIFMDDMNDFSEFENFKILDLNDDTVNDFTFVKEKIETDNYNFQKIDAPINTDTIPSDDVSRMNYENIQEYLNLKETEQLVETNIENTESSIEEDTIPLFTLDLTKYETKEKQELLDLEKVVESIPDKKNVPIIKEKTIEKKQKGKKEKITFPKKKKNSNLSNEKLEALDSEIGDLIVNDNVEPVKEILNLQKTKKNKKKIKKKKSKEESITPVILSKEVNTLIEDDTVQQTQPIKTPERLKLKQKVKDKKKTPKKNIDIVNKIKEQLQKITISQVIVFLLLIIILLQFIYIHKLNKLINIFYFIG